MQTPRFSCDDREVSSRGQGPQCGEADWSVCRDIRSLFHVQHLSNVVLSAESKDPYPLPCPHVERHLLLLTPDGSTRIRSQTIRAAVELAANNRDPSTPSLRRTRQSS